MGMFDDAMKNSVPGGNLTTPIAVAVGALILGKLFGGGSSPAPAPSAPSRAPQAQYPSPQAQYPSPQAQYPAPQSPYPAPQAPYPAPQAPYPAPQAPYPAPASLPPNPPNSSIIGGLSDLIGKLTAGGAGPQVNSWVGHGQNEPIPPGQLGGALGGGILDELTKRTGMSQQELLNQLAAVLPQVINSLTPKGRMPTLADLEEPK